MPSGDGLRTWFPEMVAVLRQQWRETMSTAELIRLRDRLDAMLQSIRSERGIRAPLMTCPKCERRARAADPRVSVRGMLFSLSRFGIASHADVQKLERAWIKYRRENNLDIHGAPAQCQPTP